MCKQRRAGTYLRKKTNSDFSWRLIGIGIGICAKNNQMVIGDSMMKAFRSYLSTVNEETKQRTSWTMAITIAHSAQHNTTGYSSCKFFI